MTKAKRDLWTSWAADRRGNVAVVFALTVTSVVLIGGGALDLMTVTSNRNYLQERVDATALYVANGLNASNAGGIQSKAQARLSSVVDAKQGVLSDVAATSTGTTLTVSAKLTTKSNFLSLIGMANMVASATSTVTWGDTGLEISMVLDTTGSMADSGKLAALKTAGTSFVNSIAAKATSGNSIKFALVPFSNFVNVGSTYKNAAWMDTAAASPYHSSYFSASKNRFSLYTALGKTWPGCVETRPSPYDMDDTAPTAANPSTLFVPAFNPDEPDDGTYPNNYLDDDIPQNCFFFFCSPSTTDQLTEMLNASKYTTLKNKDFSNSNFYSNYHVPKGPGFGCDAKPVQRLTTDTTSVVNQINALTVAGSTNLPEGVAWGWRMLSPKGPFADGKDYGAGVAKILVILTDGTNAINTFSTPLGGAYSSWGYPYSNRLGNNPGTNLRNGLDAKTRAACEAIKAKGIQIYTIGLMIDDAAGQQLLSDCSSGADYYFNSPSAAQLDAIFTTIATKIVKLRISS